MDRARWPADPESGLAWSFGALGGLALLGAAGWGLLPYGVAGIYRALGPDGLLPGSAALAALAMAGSRELPVGVNTLTLDTPVVMTRSGSVGDRHHPPRAVHRGRVLPAAATWSDVDLNGVGGVPAAFSEGVLWVAGATGDVRLVDIDRLKARRIDGRTGDCTPYGQQMCRRGRPFDDRVAALHGDARTAAGRVWAQVALDEHASIASFARHTLELLAVGVPLELVDGALAAQRDELEHARLALGLAVRFGADPALGFGPLDTRVPARSGLAEILLAVAVEGCLGETLAAVEAAVALEQCDDPEIRAVLETIVADEARHAALAWRTLVWGLPRLDASDRALVLAALVAERAEAPGPELPSGIGVLGGDEAAAARAWGLNQIVRPAVAALSAA